MLKLLSFTILLLDGLVLLTSEVAFSRPATLNSKYPVISRADANTPVCYLRTPSGRTLDLTGMCGDNLAKVSSTYQPPVYNATPRQNAEVPNTRANRGTTTFTNTTGGTTTPYRGGSTTGGTNFPGAPSANTPPITLGAPGSDSLVAPGSATPPSIGNSIDTSTGSNNGQGSAGATTTNTNSNRVINNLGAPGANSLGGTGATTTTPPGSTTP